MITCTVPAHDVIFESVFPVKQSWAVGATELWTFAALKRLMVVQ